MTVLLDNLAASLVMGALLLMLLTVQHRERMAALEQTSFHAMRQQQITLTETLERDLRNATRFHKRDMSVTDTTFSFDTVLSAGTASKRVEYRIRPRGSRDGQALYQLYRAETGGGALTYVAVSPPTLMTWTLTGLNKSGNAAADTADTKQVRMASAALTPFAALQSERVPAVKAVRWGMTFRPAALRSSERL